MEIMIELDFRSRIFLNPESDKKNKKSDSTTDF